MRKKLILALALVLIAVALLYVASCKTTTPPTLTKQVDRIVIIKSAHTMMLMRDGKTLKTYEVALGRGGAAPKERAGDHRTPEGEYVIDSKNEHSRFFLALRISYPNTVDVQRAGKSGVDPGNAIEIHGLRRMFGWLGSLHRLVDWTDGCIAVTNPEIEEIWPVVRVGTAVEIRH